MATTRLSLEEFLRPLKVDIPKIHSLARSFCETFRHLAAESQNQFLPTPISEALLSHSVDRDGRYLALDIGGTNLRVAFIELWNPAKSSEENDGEDKALGSDKSRVRCLLEKAWPIGEHLKSNNAEDLFAWIGKCVAEVVRDGCQAWEGELPEEIPMGVSFSFPMIQNSLSDATLMSMGKGFTISSNLDLRKQLLDGYEIFRTKYLPRVKVAAIANDTVATLVSFVYQLRSSPRRKAAMGLIVGTGCNATICLALSQLHPNKRTNQIQILEGSEIDHDPKIAVNTEWTINGAAGPLHDLDFITFWDKILDAEGEAPGFQPFEYMTAGRYLGELGRIIIVDYFTNHLGIPIAAIPPILRQRHGLTTAFLGNLGPHLSHFEPSILKQLEAELPPDEGPEAWKWTPEAVDVVLRIAKAIQARAAGMTAAAVIGLLACADQIHLSRPSNNIPNGAATSTAKPKEIVEELVVGYTGSCIVHFQDYLDDCQGFLDKIMEREFGGSPAPRVVLQPCHSGGIIGAGILAGTVQSIGA